MADQHNTESNTPRSYINYLVDADSVVWMEAGWDDDDEALDGFAQLLYELHSGSLMGDSLEFIKEQCESPEQKSQYHKILRKLNNLFFTESGSEKPVVPPTRVFSQYGG